MIIVSMYIIIIMVNITENYIIDKKLCSGNFAVSGVCRSAILLLPVASKSRITAGISTDPAFIAKCTILI